VRGAARDFAPQAEVEPAVRSVRRPEGCMNGNSMGTRPPTGSLGNVRLLFRHAASPENVVRSTKREVIESLYSVSFTQTLLPSESANCWVQRRPRSECSRGRSLNRSLPLLTGCVSGAHSPAAAGAEVAFRDHAEFRVGTALNGLSIVGPHKVEKQACFAVWIPGSKHPDAPSIERWTTLDGSHSRVPSAATVQPEHSARTALQLALLRDVPGRGLHPAATPADGQVRKLHPDQSGNTVATPKRKSIRTRGVGQDMGDTFVPMRAPR